MARKAVNVIGAGLAGSEAAWQIAKRGLPVTLFEMRPEKQTAAHHTGQFAELVCTNSLRSNSITNAVGILKEEMRHLDSLVMKAADTASVPAGGALAVDRHDFSGMITRTLKEMPNVTVVGEEAESIPEGITIIATGPLTSDKLSASIQRLTGEKYFYFYDAAAPIILGETIDRETVYLKSRYDKGDAAYLNCPMNKEEFDAFFHALVTAETAPLKEFEKENYFSGCMPIEVMARRGAKTLLFGPLKPVGLEDPRTGKRPFAVVQLRQDNTTGSLFNMVGFQTHLKWGEQKRVFQMILGLEHAEIVRYGVMHRNTFLNAPLLLEPTYQTKARDDLFFAGQMTGVEGYVESAASGLIAGINAAKLYLDKNPVTFPEETVIGSMAHYITTTSSKNFQPMNANFGLLPPLTERVKDKKLRAEHYASRALELLRDVIIKL
ncbi:FADH(2)-oxidizing methylenetetrahydrofolate--tRNA-(uracil(54)-C(5))-methyltransferase TrmFO [Sporolactobacillus shoreicorticis]|uniref:Methylenetetrahydrofolate--tRNA-(uracil-5-)-methyltransferase TrmFO n=1 Tax=Sporolactobacillus shoreicorticis TaxID=1923877 RepID=A0ABW5S7X8_9BACL|nr:FADH(2)-oxidizing methylenetetrahydrofolate--tRNA-(uracil(54)-C(5))-methyltransferase TrmFO [Sporolactobacillus shoreicorticis]MCO7126005.1 FADH(2)-oxidizing methylenetetrahydrofolate--tRNA-(uracil(54)-C(5))-methyltransferase TrmFO [Sporolactobacillus shoreicorticis]